MKRVLLFLTSIIILAGVLSSCSSSTKVAETTVAVETTQVQETVSAAKESVNKMSEREFGFNPDVKFVYTEDDDYLKAITDDMVLTAGESFIDQSAVEIPTPYIVKTDASDKNDVKVYGDFYIYGYEMFGTIFNTKNGGSYPGCYHLKDEDGKITVINREIAADGSDNWSSMVKICGGDESLAKEVMNAPQNDKDNANRILYAKMYAKANNLKLSGIKDYGWPVILFGDISDAEFLYNFYSAYFYEIRQEDYLNDMPERLENLKKKYMTESLISKMDSKTSESGADAMINAQDVTDMMIDTLNVVDLGNGSLEVSFDTDPGSTTKFNVKVETKNGKKVITDIA